MIGMLWLDDDKTRPLAEKVRRAADYYLKKYGRAAEVCQVNHLALIEPAVMGGVQVRPVRNMPVHHFLIGLE